MPKLVASSLTEAEFLSVKAEKTLGVNGDGLKLSFSDLSAHVRLPNGDNKTIMDRISGVAHTGQVMAVMGPTGCGKTTFLSVLGHRLDPSISVSGRVSYGGQPWTPSLKRRVGFIEQDDVTFPELTVRQALTFAARLRLSPPSPPRSSPPSWSQARSGVESSMHQTHAGSGGGSSSAVSTLAQQRRDERDERVDELLQQMQLEGCADVRIGGGLVRGVSGGQRKRVCIATELIAKPTFLFCDEPTSGLDSETALVIISVLQNLTSASGMCIICSIHQPSSQVYSQFDDLCFLDGGRCVYFGKAGETALDHFAKLAGCPCPPKFNPPDWFMEQAVNGKFAGARMDLPTDTDLTTFHGSIGSKQGHEVDEHDSGYAASFTEQVMVIVERSWVKVKVEKLNGPFFLQNAAIGVIAGCLFVGLGNKEADIFPRVSFSFNFLMGSLYLPIMEVLFVFLQDSLTLRKELLCKAHHPFAYYLAKTISVFPVLAILVTMMSVSIYTLSFYKSGNVQQFLALVSAQFVIGNVFASLGICIAAWVANPAYLMTTTLIVLVWLFTFAGFFVPRADINPALAWMVTVNPAAYSFALYFQIILMVGQEPTTFKCSKLSVYEACDTDNPDNNASGDEKLRIHPEDVLEYYEMDTPIWVCFAVLVGMYFSCFFLGYYLFHQKVAAWLK